jgi:thiol-disulfide isomerase/thioredoxin
MKQLYLILASLLLTLSLYSQSDSTYFSGAIKINFKKYKKESELAYRKANFERGKFLFDSLVDHRLAGTTFDDFTLKQAKGGKLLLSKIQKPTILITYASWCVFSPGEVQALNKLAQKYGKEVKFVVLFWDRKQNISKICRKFSKNITVCYAHEHYRNDAPLVAALKHTLGFPTTFFLDEDLTVVDIRRCGVKLCPKKTKDEKAYVLNYNNFLDGLDILLINKDLQKEMLATK